MKTIILLSITFILLTHEAYATMGASNVQSFNPTINRNADFISVYTSDSLGKRKFNVVSYFDFANDTLPVFLSPVSPTESDDSALFNHLLISYGITNRLDFGVSLLNLINQEADQSQSGGFFASEGLINTRGFLKFKAYGKEKNMFGLSFIGSVSQIGVTNTPYHGVDPGPSIGLEVAIDNKIGRFTNTLNFGYVQANPGDPVTGANGFLPVEQNILASLGTQFSFTSKTKLVLELHSSVVDSDTEVINREAFSLEALAAFKYSSKAFKKYGLSFTAGVTSGLNDGISTPSLRIFSGLGLSFGTRKRKIVKKEEPVEREVAAVEEPIEEEIQEVLEIEEITREPESISFDDIVVIEEDDEPEAVLETFKPEITEPSKIVLNYVEFAFDSYELDQKSKQTLDSIARLLLDRNVTSATIIGHTDYLGNTMYNEKLSLARSRAVKKYLIQAGVKPYVLISRGFGERRILATGIDSQNRQKNRRVEILIPGETR